jgi:hypothetical protein
MGRARILTIIGELDNQKTVNTIHRRLAKSGFLVFLPPRRGDDSSDDAALDVNIMACIDRSHIVFVIDPNGKQSPDTKRHIAYAMEHDKIVVLLSTKSKVNGEIMSTIEIKESLEDEIYGDGLREKRDRYGEGKHSDRFDMNMIDKQRTNLRSMRETIHSKLGEE